MDALEFAERLKQHAWKISDYLSCGTDTVERALEEHLNDPSGDYVPSRGMRGPYQLRRPMPDTFQQVIALLSNEEVTVRRNASKALALYAEAFDLETVYGSNRVNRQQLSEQAVPPLLRLLDDPDATTRGVAALALGRLASRRRAAAALTRAFKREQNNGAKIKMTWALQRLF